MTTATSKEVAVADQPSAMKALAERMGVEASPMFMASLRNVAFKSPNVTNEQLMALVVVANQYKLNPFTRELYAFPESEKRGGGIVPIVSVDGWFRIINEHPQFDGLEYKEIESADGKLVAGEVTIYRKDRTHALVIREHLAEVERNTDPWKINRRRMLRHKTIIQGARIAFGFAGIYEPDEGERIIESVRSVKLADTQTGAERVGALLDAQPVTPAETAALRKAALEDGDETLYSTGSSSQAEKA